jgi:hypothetical protein
MIDYTSSLAWLAAWPVVIYLSYKFVRLNINHLKKLEKLDEEQA